MKRKPSKKKLSLNKITVAKLDNREALAVKGGTGITWLIYCTITIHVSDCICTGFPGGTCGCPF